MTRPAPDSAEPGPGGASPEGFVLFDKPAGITSHDVVARVRRAHGAKAGHAGTLDPFATGLLIVLLGRATRLQRYVLGSPKSYLATARLGWRSSTGDSDGELEHTGRVPEDLSLPTGRISQVPPMTSAVKVGGERLYRKARRGEEVEREAREVEVTRAELVSVEGDEATFAIDCSSGTYIRVLVEELGDAYCSALRRTAIGPFRIEEAGEEVRPIGDLVGFLPIVDLSAEQARLVRNGIRIPAPSETPGEGPVRLLHDGTLVAVAHVEDGRLRTEMVLA